MPELRQRFCRVNNITSDNVVVHIESEEERLNTNAETYIKLGDTLKAHLDKPMVEQGFIEGKEYANLQMTIAFHKAGVKNPRFQPAII